MFANSPACEVEQLRGRLRGPWRQGLRAVMVLLSLRGLAPAEIAALLQCHPGTVRRWIGRFNSDGVAGLADLPRCGRPRLGERITALLQLTRRAEVLAEDETHPHLLPHIRASWTRRGRRPQIPTPGKNRQVTVFGAPEVTTGWWAYRLGLPLRGQLHRFPGPAAPGRSRTRR